jgi:carbonic anhydrase
VKYLSHLFDNNRRWAAERIGADPQYFQRLSGIQRPDYLWIGCADSRVPANVIVGLAPGEMFVHRNIANLVAPDDPNCMAVIQFAVEVLGVKHVIVTGHYGCGGVKAALDGSGDGFVKTWLAPLAELARQHRDELQNAGDAWKRLCEINVRQQVEVLSRTPLVQDAWAAGRELKLHGWIYALQDGLLRDLDVTRSAED